MISFHISLVYYSIFDYHIITQVCAGRRYAFTDDEFQHVAGMTNMSGITRGCRCVSAYLTQRTEPHMYSLSWRSMAKHVMVWHDMAWYCMAWHHITERHVISHHIEPRHTHAHTHGYIHTFIHISVHSGASMIADPCSLTTY